MKIDPRIRRTRARLHESLLTLSTQHGYDQVTVQDILRHSETARSTFYAHFQDKDDLLLSGFEENDTPLFARDGSGHGDPIQQFADTLFGHIDANKSMAKVFFGSSAAPIMMGHLRNLIVVEARALITACPAQAQLALPEELQVQFVAGTAFSLIVWWVDHDFCYSTQEMGDACRRFITSGLARELSQQPLKNPHG